MNPVLVNDPRQFLKKFIKNITLHQKTENFFSASDYIMLGVSGGKDSLLLLEILGVLSLRYKFRVVPVHIRIKSIGYSVDLSYMEALCQQHGFSLMVHETEIDFDPEHKKGPCFVCSWHRRKQLFQLAKVHGCNKLALGHHRDDAIQTLLMNMIYHGSISSMPSRLSMFQGSLEIIRPLITIAEKDIIAYQEIRNYPKLLKDCPYGSNTQRNQMKELIREIQDIHPQAGTNIFNSMSKIFPSYLPLGEKSIISGLNEIHPPATPND